MVQSHVEHFRSLELLKGKRAFSCCRSAPASVTKGYKLASATKQDSCFIEKLLDVALL